MEFRRGFYGDLSDDNRRPRPRAAEEGLLCKQARPAPTRRVISGRTAQKRSLYPVKLLLMCLLLFSINGAYLTFGRTYKRVKEHTKSHLYQT